MKRKLEEEKKIIESETEYKSMEERFNEIQVQKKSNQSGSGCGALLLIGLALFTLILGYNWFFGDGGTSYDPNDWNFDGKVDYDDAVKKLEWHMKNE